MDFYKLAVAFFMALWPPRGEAGDTFRHWRVNVSVVAMASFAGNVLITLCALGYVLWLYPGVATAADLKEQSAAMSALVDKFAPVLASLQRGQLDAKLRDLDRDLTTDRRAFCVADHVHNGAAKEFARLRFNDDYKTYFSLSGGVAWRIPDCAELL